MGQDLWFPSQASVHEEKSWRGIWKSSTILQEACPRSGLLCQWQLSCMIKLERQIVTPPILCVLENESFKARRSWWKRFPVLLMGDPLAWKEWHRLGKKDQGATYDHSLKPPLQPTLVPWEGAWEPFSWFRVPKCIWIQMCSFEKGKPWEFQIYTSSLVFTSGSGTILIGLWQSGVGTPNFNQHCCSVLTAFN